MTTIVDQNSPVTPETRPADGILNLLKPPHVTSRDVVNDVCRVVGTRQVGHAGTLDPLATGVLVICVGQATRLVSCVQDQHKHYDAEFLLGRSSDTDDITGVVVEREVAVPPTRDEIERLLPRFRGRITQVPPQYSAVRVKGRRAYKLARQGVDVEVPAREVEVYRLDITHYDYPRLGLTMECGSGTYVRSIGRDIGELLGCGAVMETLVRTRIGPFDIADAIPVSQLRRETVRDKLQPIARAVTHLPRHVCTLEEIEHVRHGRPIRPAGYVETGDFTLPLALFNQTEELIALGEWRVEKDAVHPKTVFIL